jgi:hypothetical protein
MAPFTVALEHLVVVLVMAVHAHIALLLSNQFVLRFHPELNAVAARPSSDLPFLVGAKPNVVVRNQLSIVFVVAGGDSRFRWDRWSAWTSVGVSCMFVMVLGHDLAPLDPEIT